MWRTRFDACSSGLVDTVFYGLSMRIPIVLAYSAAAMAFIGSDSQLFCSTRFVYQTPPGPSTMSGPPLSPSSLPGAAFFLLNFPASACFCSLPPLKFLFTSSFLAAGSFRFASFLHFLCFFFLVSCLPFIPRRPLPTGALFNIFLHPFLLIAGLYGCRLPGGATWCSRDSFFFGLRVPPFCSPYSLLLIIPFLNTSFTDLAWTSWSSPVSLSFWLHFVVFFF